MKNKLNCILLLLTLHFSCVENKSTNGATNKFALKAISTTDSLKFTSGIRSIFQDSKGNYWFGSIREGVALYDGNSFTYFTSNDGLSDNQVIAIQEDNEGNVWFNTLQGVSSYDGTRIKNHTKHNINNSQNTLPIQGNEPIQGNWMKSDEDLWFGAGNKEGAFRFDGQKLYYLVFPKSKVSNPNNLCAVTGISKGKNNMIWFGTYAGVFGYNGKAFTIINDASLGLNVNLEPLHIRSILEDSKGRLWIGNNGIGVLLKEGDSTINFSDKHKLIHPTSSKKGEKSLPGTLEHVFTITEDRKGNIWFGDRDAGIWKYDGVKMTNYTKKDGLTNDNALSIFEDDKGELWFGMEDGKVYKFNGKTFERQF